MKQIAEVYRKIRNTFRFLLGNLADFSPQTDRVAVEDLNELDRYALLKLQRLVERVTKGYDAYDFHSVYYQIHHYCTVFLSQFYLDVLKDRLYVLPKEDQKRRSSQTVMYETLVALVKMVHPILPHTTEEVWKYIPDVDTKSIQLTDFPQVKANYLNAELESKWDRLVMHRDTVLKALEEARANQGIGNSLGALVELYPSEESAQLLSRVDDLEELFIVSQVHLYQASDQPEGDTVEGDGLRVKIKPAEGEKCQRCWMISPSVGQNDQHPDLCDRCADIVEKHFAD